MITKNFKIVLIAILITAVSVPVLGMDFVSGQEAQIDKNLRIDEPKDSAAKIAIQERADELFAEEASLYAEGSILKAKYDAVGKQGLTTDEIKELDRIAAEITNVKLRIDKLNADSRSLITLTQAEKDVLHEAVMTIANSEIPFTGAGSDQNAGAVMVEFPTAELGDKYAPTIEQLIDVPFYTAIGTGVTLDACGALDDNCDPLLGGVQITTQFNSTFNPGCSYSTATERDVFWWTDYGFLTAAHCFEDNADNNDVWQPDSDDSKIGDLDIWKWDETDADCDCAFVIKSGSEMHWKAAYEGPNDSLTFGGFADPEVNDFVTIVGANGIHTNLIVDQVDYVVSSFSADSPPITHSMIEMLRLDNWGTSGGDSGGVVHATGTDPDYHGIIHGHDTELGSGLGGETIASQWSNIDGNFNLND
jgi:hypothetical protein